MQKGHQHSEKAKKKMSETHTGKILSEKHKENIRKALKGRPSPMKGRKHSEKWRKETSKRMSGKNHPQYGKRGEQAVYWKGGSRQYYQDIAYRIWKMYWKQRVLKGYAIHHIDGNKKNNNITNLALITSSEHSKIHWRKRKDVKL